MKSINQKNFIKIFLFTLPVSLFILILIYTYGDLFIKFLPILIKLFSINNNNNNTDKNLQYSVIQTIVHLKNHSNKSLFMNKQKLYLKTHNIPFQLPAQMNCGQSKFELNNNNNNKVKRIVRGDETHAHQYPWMASLKHFKNDQVLDHFCAGSLIYADWILTASHCVYGLKSDSFVVVLGLHYLNESYYQNKYQPQSQQIFKVSKIIINENYSHKDPNYDIALIKLENKVKLNKYVSTICLPESSTLTDSILNEYAIVAGWGRNPDAKDLIVSSNNRKLHHTYLKVINGQSLCSKHLQEFDSYSNLYCAFDLIKNSNVCK